MLNSLHVKNLALIEETEVHFEKGLNILTGETGAGKSVIIGSINLALGAKADRDMIRTGKEYALIELIFTLDDEKQRERCLELDVEPEDDMIIISRKITAGKSLCRVNGAAVTARQLKELAEVLIDVYGQHEHQSLTARKKQLEILDSFCGESLKRIKEKASGEYKRYMELKKEWEESDLDSESRQKECALIEFECHEIDEAQPKPGEEEALESAYRRMANARRILEGVSLARHLLGSMEEESVSDLAGRALREMKAVEGYDNALAGYTARLSEIEELAADLCRELADYEEGLEFEPEAFTQAESRLDVLNHLKSRYGATLSDVLAYREAQEARLEKLTDYDAYLETLSAAMQAAREKLLASCEKISAIRQKQAKALEKKMTQALHDLNFMEVNFQIRLSQDPDRAGAKGYDEVEFLISTNPGEPVKPLGSIASGGELSRIMLGLKTVMAEKDAIDTLLFDEIDAGISGRTAWQVSRKLGILGREHQIICITHLPQIAAMADLHFKIEKKQKGNQTRTDISILEEDESIRELARLLGSDLLTKAALSNAREMKDLARDTKQY